MLSIHGAMSLGASLVAREVDASDIKKILDIVSRIKQGDPFQAASEQTYLARRAYWIEGNYGSTVSAAYTAGEVLLNSLLLMIEWERGTPRAATRSWFEEEGLVKRLRTYYHESLGGNWSSTSGVITNWMALAELRGRVVHAGYSPTESEAEKALYTMGELSEFIKERLAAKVKVYPRTAVQLLGEPGLRRLGKWSRWIEGFVTDKAGNEDPWIASFHQWLNEEATPTARQSTLSSV